MQFELNGLKKNKQEFEIKKAFFKFGFVIDFKYDRQAGIANLNIDNLKKIEFEEYCRINNIEFIEQESRKQNKNNSNHDKNKSQESKTDSFPNISNPSFHYYKEICKDNKDPNCYGRNIESFKFENNFSELYDFNLSEKQTFELTTIYPGLLIGSGNNHPKLSESKDDFQLGFFFDHTTGLPIISGSSIKGLLRSVFEETNFLKEVYSKYYKDYMNIDVFEKGQIVFHDAFIVSTKNENNKIFGSDYITSHFSSEENGMFKEPNPVKFLKVLPAVTFKFQFKSFNEKLLSNHILNEYINLFKQIILDFGLGAKTNVGYGKFQE